MEKLGGRAAVIAAGFAVCGLHAAAQAPRPDLPALTLQVTKTEQAFAQTMADRDPAAFQRFIEPDAVFVSGAGPLRRILQGKPAIAQAWQPYFEGTVAPFRWAPDEVVVLATGDLAHSSGPVHDAQGRLVGRFNSVWRRGSDGQWRVVFDRGEAPTTP